MFVMKKQTKTTVGCKFSCFFFHKTTSSYAMGPTMLPQERFLINFPGSIVPAEGCAVISRVFGRRASETARLDF